MPWFSKKRKCHHCVGSGIRQVACTYHEADEKSCTDGKLGTRCSSCQRNWKPEDERKFGNPYLCRSCNGSSFYRPICPSCKGSSSIGLPCQFCAETGEEMHGHRSVYAYEEFLPFGRKKRKLCHHCFGSGERRVACQYVTANGESCHEGNYFCRCLSCNGTGQSSHDDTMCGSCPGSGWQKFTCPSCHGTGSIEQTCQLCDGCGQIDDQNPSKRVNVLR